MSAYIARAKEVNPLINAVITDNYEEAFRRARQLDSVLDTMTQEDINTKYSRKDKPLLGVPLSVKGAFCWAGRSLIKVHKICHSDLFQHY